MQEQWFGAAPGGHRDGAGWGFPVKTRAENAHTPRSPSSCLQVVSPRQGLEGGLRTPFSASPRSNYCPFQQEKPSHGFPHPWLMQSSLCSHSKTLSFSKSLALAKEILCTFGILPLLRVFKNSSRKSIDFFVLRCVCFPPEAAGAPIQWAEATEKQENCGRDKNLRY